MKTSTKPRHSTPAQRQYISSLVGYDADTKEEAVQWATGDIEKRSAKDLTYDQADKLIKQLTGANNRPLVHPYGAFDAKNPRHRKILSLCITYGWKKLKNGKEVADINRLGEWLENDPRAPVHKPLKKQDHDELSKTVFALEKLIKWKYK
ncbi:hypothetical protein Q4603_05810 [Zobellia galactanivorans]|uniref:hypothetical protein n=1 Tax=Zobellia galactanivorans (strain DSM 12802 / CCUG 47099 / CIP 106680 / NCIMB 13871 / Dsij) TaxID=63186 RepID=UPI0026E49105|nr:hypothetical protein [Zobellia galactanivorans]MDO6808111.1 hypothetical protein [Zobellia galactanivorans]